MINESRMCLVVMATCPPRPFLHSTTKLQSFSGQPHQTRHTRMNSPSLNFFVTLPSHAKPLSHFAMDKLTNPLQYSSFCHAERNSRAVALHCRTPTLLFCRISNTFGKQSLLTKYISDMYPNLAPSFRYQRSYIPSMSDSAFKKH
jgi:hypothetical protein